MSRILFSDVHLLDSDSVKTRLVVRFMQEVASRFQDIYILGDLFDVWPGTTPFLVERFRPVLDVLRTLVAEGHTIRYIEGNHDFRLGDYFSNELGIRVYPNELIEDWGEKRVYLAHGDLGNPKDVGYRALRRVLRHSMLHRTLSLFPDEWIFRAGAVTSGASRKYGAVDDAKTESIRKVYRENAMHLFDQGHDVVVMGHTHIPDDYRVEVRGKEHRYLNSGDWVKHFTYLEFDGVDFYTKWHPLKEN